MKESDESRSVAEIDDALARKNSLLRGRSVQSTLERLGGRLSRLEAVVGEQEVPGRRELSIELLVNSRRFYPQAAKCLHSLAESLHRDDQYWLLTCPCCGHAECAGIRSSFFVVHDQGLTLWRMKAPTSARCWVFETKAYRATIWQALSEIARQLEFSRDDIQLVPPVPPDMFMEHLREVQRQLGCAMPPQPGAEEAGAPPPYRRLA